MSKRLTAKENEVFNYIVQYKSAHDGNSPTFQEIMENTDVTSKSVVFYYLNMLERKGYIERERINDGVQSRNILIKGGKWLYQE